MYNTEMSEFQKNLKKYRKLRGITLQDLGNHIGKTKATISKYERGEIIPDIITILEICNILNISLSQLFPINHSSTDISHSHNPFNVNKLYLYYYSENILITSILEIEENNNISYVKFFNGIKNINNYAKKTNYYYEGIMECDKTIGYINLHNPTSQTTQLEKIQISFNIPWLYSVEFTNFFILALTPNSMPIVKKGIISINPITDFSVFKEDFKITKDDFTKLQKNNGWVLENRNYNLLFYNK